MKWLALGLAIWGAALSTFLAARQVVRERRQLRVLLRTLVSYQSPDSDESGESQFYDVLEVRAHNAGTRPVYVMQAGTVMGDGGIFLPFRVTAPGAKRPPCMVEDGETVTFYFDVLSFEDGLMPREVWVEDSADRRYTERVSKKLRKDIEEAITRARERVGPEVRTQGQASKSWPFPPE